MTDPAPADEVVTPQGAGGTIWDAPNQQVVRADQSTGGWYPATGANAGIPGTWTPTGTKPPVTPPASPTELAQSTPTKVTASPATAWTTGQYVQTATAGAPGRACWTGSSWVSGAAP